MPNFNPYKSPSSADQESVLFDFNRTPVVLTPSRGVVIFHFAMCLVLAFPPAMLLYTGRSDFFMGLYGAVSFVSFLLTVRLFLLVHRARIEISSTGIHVNWPHVEFSWRDVASFEQGKYSGIEVTLRNGQKTRVAGPATAGRGTAIIRSAMEHFQNTG